MQSSSLFAVLLLLIPLIISASSSYEESDNNERFARDVDFRKKFAFAFAKRSGSGDELMVDPRTVQVREPATMRFAFAKRKAPKEFARFARASFA